MKLIKIQDHEPQNCWDVEVEGTHNFYANGILVHNSNASFAFNAFSDMWYQSRKNIITPQKDNAGFAFFAESNKEKLYELVDSVIIENDIDTSLYTTTIYGEWCGGNIQKGVAISQLPKMFVIFGAKISPIEQDTDEASYWVDHTKLESPDNGIYNINNFPTFEVEIDFNRPDKAVDTIIKMVLDVEKECPVGKALGVSGIGEGIVFTCEYKDTRLRFKAKGKEHAGKSKVKTLSPVDVEKENRKIAFANSVVTEERLQQGWQEIFGINEEKGIPEMRKMGDFLKWVANDVIDEEMDILVTMELEPKDVKRHISNIGRNWFERKLNARVGL